MFSLRTLLLSFIAIFCGLVSLSAAEETPYIPLKVGAEWTMDATLVSPNGAVLHAIARRVVENGVERDGKKYLRERTWLEVDGKKVDEYTKLVRKDDSGFYSILEGKEGATEQREIVLPLKAGSSWEFASRNPVLKCTVIGVETVTIGSKTYQDCFHLRSTAADGTYAEDFWEAPIEGSVKSVSSYGDGIKATMTVKEFKAGK